MKILGKKAMITLPPQTLEEWDTLIIKGVKYEVRKAESGWYLNSIRYGFSNDHMFNQMGVNKYEWCTKNGIVVSDHTGVFPYMSKEDLERTIILLGFKDLQHRSIK